MVLHVLHVLPNDDERFHIWRSDDYASSQQLSFTLRLNMKAIRAEQAKVHVAYFTQRDQHEIIT